MFGKTVILEDKTKGIKIEVWVCCTPNTSEEELKARAINQVMNYITGY
jgi:hypothetical protein